MLDNRITEENQATKLYLLELHVPQWKIALRLNMSEAKLTRLLRTELSEEMAAKIRSIADEIASERR